MFNTIIWSSENNNYIICQEIFLSHDPHSYSKGAENYEGTHPSWACIFLNICGLVF